MTGGTLHEALPGACPRARPHHGNEPLQSGFLSTLVLCLSLPAVAMQPRELEPVDQAVEDLDPLARSLRQVSRGLHVYGEQTSLFKPIVIDGEAHREPVYYRLGPGFTARVNRLDYLVPRGEDEIRLNEAPEVDGEFAELIPADTVFELRPISELILRPPRPDRPARRLVSSRFWQTGPIDTRIDTRIEGRIITLLDMGGDPSAPR